MWMAGEELCQMPESSEADVNAAVQSCREAFADWSNRSGKQRGDILVKAAQIIKVLLYCWSDNYDLRNLRVIMVVLGEVQELN